MPEPDLFGHVAPVKQSGACADYCEPFRQFYSAYPNKSEKHNAHTKWHQLERSRLLPPLESLLRAVKAQQQSKQWMQGFIPNPAKWLHGHKWADSLPAPPPPARHVPPTPPKKPEKEPELTAAEMKAQIDEMKAKWPTSPYVAHLEKMYAKKLEGTR